MEVLGLTSDPKDHTIHRRFPADTPEIFLVFRARRTAPGTIVRSTWRQQGGESESDSASAKEGEQSLSIRPRAAGQYTVELAVGDRGVQTLSFEIEALP